jgi:hypothetical protein
VNLREANAIVRDNFGPRAYAEVFRSGRRYTKRVVTPEGQHNFPGDMSWSEVIRGRFDTETRSTPEGA